jgi:hypothetical protein
MSELKDYPNSYRMAVANDWCHGLVYYVLNGGYSPKLYAQIFPPEPRPRFTCQDPGGKITKRVDAERGKKSRADFVVDLLDYWQGVGAVRY